MSFHGNLYFADVPKENGIIRHNPDSTPDENRCAASRNRTTAPASLSAQTGSRGALAISLSASDIVDTVREPLLVLDGEQRVRLANRSFYRSFQTTESETIGQLLYNLGNGQWNIPQLRSQLEEILPKKAAFEDFEVEHEFQGIGRKVMRLNARQVVQESGQGEYILLAIEDITERRRYEEERRSVETRFTSLVKNIRDHSIFTLDPQGIITSWNLEAERILGFSETDAIGQPFSIIFTAEDRAKGMDDFELRTALAEGRAEDERWHVRKNQEQFWALGIVTPTFDAAGVHTGYSKILRDMTERKRAAEALEQSEQRFRSLIDHLPAAAYTCDASGMITYFNRRAVELWGRTPKLNDPADRYCGSFKLFSTQGTPITHDQCWMALTLRDCQEYCGREIVIERPDSSRRSALAYACPFRDDAGNLQGAVNVIVDITAQQRVTQELHERQRQLKFVTDYAPVFLAHIDRDLRYKFVNRAYAQRFGTTPEAVIGKRVDEVVGASASAAVHHHIETVLAGTPVEFEIAISFDKLGQRVMQCSYVPEVDETGTIQGMLAVIVDVTDRRQNEEALRRSESHLRTVLDTTPECIKVMDRDGKILHINAAGLSMLGAQDESEVRGLCLFDLLEAQERIAYERFHESVCQGNKESHEFEIVNFQGLRRHMESHAAPLKNSDSAMAYVAVTHDITERKRQEEELRLADRRKDEFLATLAHELRNPLAPLGNTLQVLKVPNLDAGMLQQSREIMERQLNHLVRLVDDLLDVSRVMRNKVELRREIVEVSAIVARSVETAQPFITKQGHQLDISLSPEPLRLDADPMRLTQVIANLLTNAAKYTEPNGHIGLTVRREGEQVVVRVRDDGIGIAPDMLPAIFDLFVQADHKTTRAQGGLGIGLTLVKNLVEMHQGTVLAHSNGLGQGSEFEVRLPLIPKDFRDNTGHSEPGFHPGSNQIGHRVLVVDDNHDAAISLAMLLRLQGHDVGVAHDGPGAIQMAASTRPDIVFLDIGMPGMDGYEVARRIRTMPGMEQVVLTALTGWGQNDDRLRSMEAGFDHHLVKPAEPAALLKLLVNLK